MNRIFLTFVVLIIGAVMGASYAGLAGDAAVSGTWRYKMSVTVETPEGEKTGSAVREVSAHSDRPFDLAKANVKGEAVVVDLGNRGVLFALMKGMAHGVDYGSRIEFDAFLSPEPPLTSEGIKYYNSLKHARAILSPGQYPMFVYFKDLNDPKTVKNVLDMAWDGKYPAIYTIKADHTEELFGKGVKIKEVVIEMTDEPVTWGIEKWLPWLPKRVNILGSLGGTPDKPFEDPTGTYLYGSEFHTGRVWQ